MPEGNENAIVRFKRKANQVILFKVDFRKPHGADAGAKVGAIVINLLTKIHGRGIKRVVIHPFGGFDAPLGHGKGGKQMEKLLYGLFAFKGMVCVLS